jgi:hypothetical protein
MSEITFIYNGKESKIQILSNQTIKEIFQQFSNLNNLDINTLSFFYKGKEIIEDLSFDSIKKLYNIKTNKITIIVLDKNNYITIKYKICKENKKDKELLLFGFSFVEKNNNNCKIIYENEERNLVAKIKIEEKEKDFEDLLEIKLVGINDIKKRGF